MTSTSIRGVLPCSCTLALHINSEDRDLVTAIARFVDVRGGEAALMGEDSCFGDQLHPIAPGYTDNEFVPGCDHRDEAT